MKTLKSFVLSAFCFVTLLSAAPAMAQRAASSPGAKSTSSSSSGGQNVNIRVSPLGLLIGSVSGDVNFALGDAWSLGPQFSYLNLTLGDTTVTGTSFGVRANYYFGGAPFGEGWYFGPGVTYVSVDVKEKNLGSDLEGSGSGTSFGAIVGYHWAWDVFNIDLGLGGSVATLGKITVKNNATGQEDSVSAGTVGAGLAAEFMIGFAF